MQSKWKAEKQYLPRWEPSCGRSEKGKDAEHQDAIIKEGTYEDGDSAGSIEPNCKLETFFVDPDLMLTMELPSEG